MGSIQYKCSQCGHVMSEFHGTCPACGVYLYVKQAPVQPVKPYTKISFRNDLIFGVVCMVAAIAGFLIWFPGRTGKVNDSGPIFLIGLAAIIGFAAIMMAFDKRDKAAGKVPSPTVFQKYTPDQIIIFGGIVVSIISVGLGVVGIIERSNPNWRGAMACLVVPFVFGFILLLARFEARKKK
jgi:hypothetical protein